MHYGIYIQIEKINKLHLHFLCSKLILQFYYLYSTYKKFIVKCYVSLKLIEIHFLDEVVILFILSVLFPLQSLFDMFNVIHFYLYLIFSNISKKIIIYLLLKSIVTTFKEFFPGFQFLTFCPFFYVWQEYYKFIYLKNPFHLVYRWVQYYYYIILLSSYVIFYTHDF